MRLTPPYDSQIPSSNNLFLSITFEFPLVDFWICNLLSLLFTVLKETNKDQDRSKALFWNYIAILANCFIWNAYKRKTIYDLEVPLL